MTLPGKRGKYAEKCKGLGAKLPDSAEVTEYIEDDKWRQNGRIGEPEKE